MPGAKWWPRPDSPVIIMKKVTMGGALEECQGPVELGWDRRREGCGSYSSCKDVRRRRFSFSPLDWEDMTGVPHEWIRIGPPCSSACTPRYCEIVHGVDCQAWDVRMVTCSLSSSPSSSSSCFFSSSSSSSSSSSFSFSCSSSSSSSSCSLGSSCFSDDVAAGTQGGHNAGGPKRGIQMAGGCGSSFTSGLVRLYNTYGPHNRGRYVYFGGKRKSPAQQAGSPWQATPGLDADQTF